MPHKLSKLFAVSNQEGVEIFIPADDIQVALDRYCDYVRDEAIEGEDVDGPSGIFEVGWLLEQTEE